ncbi:MAG: hypothetical protein ABIG42_08250 [bacterium]
MAPFLFQERMRKYPMNHKDKENQINENNANETPKSIHKPSVTEYLGPDWKEYFSKPETINRIVQLALSQRGFSEDERTHDFVAVNSITQLGVNRQKMIILVRKIKSGLIEKWSIDITSTALLWDQILDALYGSDDGCAEKVILFFESLMKPNEPEIRVDYLSRFIVLHKSLDFSKTISSIYVNIDEECAEKTDAALRFVPIPPNIGSHRREKFPSRLAFESSIWGCYYNNFMRFVIGEVYESQWITDHYQKDSTIPFFVRPDWTEKGLFMRLCGVCDHPKNVWLMIENREELVRHYPGCKMKVNVKSGVPYQIDIQIHDAPVSDFIKSSTMAKFNYAMEIRKQQMDLMHHVEEIFRDYTPESSIIQWVKI